MVAAAHVSSILGGPPVKAGIAMFFKVIFWLLAGLAGYTLIESEFDLDRTYLFLLLPLAAIISYLALGEVD
jgi:hypothetical protein